MKDGSSYRYNIQFPGKTDLEIRAGEFLETLGRKKSAVIISALNEYLDHHPELSDGSHPIVSISSISLQELEIKMKAMIDERMARIDVPAVSVSPSGLTVSAEAISKDIMEMIGDLDLHLLTQNLPPVHYRRLFLI